MLIKCVICEKNGILRRVVYYSSVSKKSAKYICDEGYLTHGCQGYKWLCEDCFKYIMNNK
jgi:hypothetical protein